MRRGKVYSKILQGVYNFATTHDVVVNILFPMYVPRQVVFSAIAGKVVQ